MKYEMLKFDQEWLELCLIYFHLKLVYKINKDYKIYGKDKYVRTLINKKYDSTICFPELNDDYCLLCRVTLELGSFIFFNYYLRPDERKHYERNWL